MATLQCRACGGVFTTGSVDGVRYFHACPPLSVPELRAALRRGDAVLTKAQADELARQDAIPVPLVLPDGYVAPGDLYLSRLSIARPNARDENVDPQKAAAAVDARGTRLASITDTDLMKSAGAGVVVLQP